MIILPIVRIEGIPLITRFKTAGELIGLLDDWGVLKVFHL